MKIRKIIWLVQFVEKIERRHGVGVDEVEQTFANHPCIHRIEKGDIKGEDIYRLLGQTDEGCYLAVFFICIFYLQIGRQGAYHFGKRYE